MLSANLVNYSQKKTKAPPEHSPMALIIRFVIRLEVQLTVFGLSVHSGLQLPTSLQQEAVLKPAVHS